jgi:hypothetical protein
MLALFMDRMERERERNKEWWVGEREVMFDP